MGNANGKVSAWVSRMDLSSMKIDIYCVRCGCKYPLAFNNVIWIEANWFGKKGKMCGICQHATDPKVMERHLSLVVQSGDSRKTLIQKGVKPWWTNDSSTTQSESSAGEKSPKQ